MRDLKPTLWLVCLGGLLAIEGFSVVYWVTFPYLSPLSIFAWIDASFVNLIAPLSPALLLLLVYSWLGVLLYRYDNRLSTRLRSLVRPVASSLRSFTQINDPRPETSRNFTSHPRILLVLGVASAIILSIIPYRLDLNPNGIPVGIDAHYYIEWVGAMLGQSPAGALSSAMAEPSDKVSTAILPPGVRSCTGGLTGAVAMASALGRLKKKSA